MVSLVELRAVGQAIMHASVEAELLGMRVVSDHLTMAFDEVAREAAQLRRLAEEAKALESVDTVGEAIG